MENPNKTRIVRILRIIMPRGANLYRSIRALGRNMGLIKPLPDTVQEQVDDAIGHGLDGMIVYVDKQVNHLHFIQPAGKTGKIKYRPTRNHYSRLPVSINYLLPFLSPNWSMTNR